MIEIIRKLIQLKRKLMSIYYTFKVKIMAKEFGINLNVNGNSSVTKKTSLGNNVNFNGMNIAGGGRVKIGNNFHSGIDCMMITQIHNYDQGTKIPYIFKDIVIEDQVWIGSRVIILGGVKIGEGAIIQAGSVVVNTELQGDILQKYFQIEISLIC
jgi:acetyltransferase-like isoleucine patch superfamily enzyme